MLLFVLCYLVRKSSCIDVEEQLGFSVQNDWKTVYHQFHNSSTIEDKYYAFITAPTKDKILMQLKALKGQDLVHYPLAGMPIVVKDNIMTMHSLYSTYSGSTSFKNANFIAPQNAEIVQRLIDLGAIIFGKANMHEFAAGITTCNQGFGCCINIIDGTRTCGGSSGGTAASIAAGYATFGLGTDTMGSVRIPSASLNIIGYRPTQDRYPIHGVFPLTHTTDTIGLMSSNIDEIIMVDWALMHDQQVNINTFYNDIQTETIRIGVPKVYFQEEIHPFIMDSFQGVLNLLQRVNGFVLMKDNDECFSDELFTEFKNMQVLVPIFAYEYPREASHYLNIYGANMTLKELFENSTGFERDMMLATLDVNNPQYMNVAFYHQLMQKVKQCRKIFHNYFVDNSVDIMVYPTIGDLPPLRIEEEFEMESNGKTYNTGEKVTRNMRPTATSGFPCVTIPAVKIEATKFVAGFEMCSLPNTDERLLKIAKIVDTIIKENNNMTIKQEL
eukprot:36654_1